MSSTTTSTPSAPSPTDNASSNTGSGGGGPTSSPLLFFVALGFGVVFTNLWIIVGVKYCFRYNQRNRAARALNEHGEPIDLGPMQHQRRRRREKKLMSMEEVNERFPLTKYKTWRSAREAEGLPAAGGVTAPTGSREASLKDEEGTVDTSVVKQSLESARPHTALSMAQQDHANAISQAPAAETNASSSSEKVPEKQLTIIERSESTQTLSERNQSVVTNLDEEDEDDDDPIRTAAPPEMLAAPGDTCAICLDNLDDDDDVRGLTCGHAFHGSCVDPWFTSRRACCPLCKADYYVPKVRLENDGLPHTGRRGRHAVMPQQPPTAWIGRRGVAFRPHVMFRPYFHHETQDSQSNDEAPSRQQRRRGDHDVSRQDPAVERETHTGGPTWRSRLPAVHMPFMPRFGRRNGQQQNNAPADVTTTEPDLEAGITR